MDFDFDTGGIETVDTRWLKESFPSEGKKILLLDADYIPYMVAFCSDTTQYSRYERGLYDIREKFNHACYLIQDAMQKAQADAVLFFVTDGKTNFRTTLTTHYKEQRSDEKPPFWQEVKDWLWSHDNVIQSVRNEADDMVSIYATERYLELDSDGVERTSEMYRLWSPYIIGSKDKDVKQVFGWHVDLDTGEHYWVDELGKLEPTYKDKEVVKYDYWRTVDGNPVGHEYGGATDTFSRGARKGEPKLKRVKVGTEFVQRLHKLSGTGFKFFCAQLIMGDTVDNYFGLPKYGAVKAYELLEQLDTKEECLQTVATEYQRVYPDTWREELTLQGRYAWMQKYVDELWEIPAWIC